MRGVVFVIAYRRTGDRSKLAPRRIVAVEKFVELTVGIRKIAKDKHGIGGKLFDKRCGLKVFVCRAVGDISCGHDTSEGGVLRLSLKGRGRKAWR